MDVYVLPGVSAQNGAGVLGRIRETSHAVVVPASRRQLNVFEKVQLVRALVVGVPVDSARGNVLACKAIFNGRNATTNTT